MNAFPRTPAVIAYIPVLGWLYVLLFQRRNPFAVFHVRQSIGLVGFLIAALAVWAVVAWLLAWIPFAMLLGTALFALVILAYGFGIFALISGAVNASKGRAVILPVFGNMANRIPL